MIAGSLGAGERPQHWDKRVSAAYLRLLGGTQKAAAKATGRAVRTIRDWESQDSWPDAKREARERWLEDMGDAARARLLSTFQDHRDSGDLSLRVLERLEPGLAPKAGEAKGPGLQVIVVGGVAAVSAQSTGEGLPEGLVIEP